MRGFQVSSLSQTFGLEFNSKLETVLGSLYRPGMNVELINTGSELMLGRVLNTHQQWLCRQLADRGYLVDRQVAIADTGAQIEAAVRDALAHADLIITTGGLGPTSDDLTRDLIAQLLGKRLIEDSAVLAHIRHFFEMRNRPMPARTQVQALIPEGGLVLHNPHGTAPGLALEVRPNPFREGQIPSWLIMLPGPPRELRPMFVDSVAPLLTRVMPPPARFVCRTLRTTGLGESIVEARLAGLLDDAVKAGLEIGYCARPGQVDVRLAARGEQAQDLVEAAEKNVRTRLRQRLYGAEDEELEVVLVRELTRAEQTVALAESCTGGCIAHRLTNVPGASNVLIAGLVTYSNAAKKKFLGVRQRTLQQHGAVSEAVARQMAQGARRQTGSDYALAVTGIAGPDGGSEAKPVGTVYLALAGPKRTVVEKNFNPYDRETFKQVTAQQGLDLLRREMSEQKKGARKKRGR